MEYVSPSMASSEIFYKDDKGNNRSNVIRSYSIERSLEHKRDNSNRLTQSHSGMFMHENAKRQTLTRKSSFNMKNYSSI